MHQERFMATHTGKCSTCGGEETLDGMVRKDAEKGLYECKDCHFRSFDNVTLYGEIAGVAASVVPKTIIDEKKTRRLFAWCFG